MSKTASEENNRLKKVKSILVTQSAPADAKSPYFDIEKKYNVKVDFRPFIEVQGIAFKDFRKQKIEILQHTAIIFTSCILYNTIFIVAVLNMPGHQK